ncbi:MAG TPA: SGNH/GDSL hydrolase family protein [Dermatophilaceae bacterium]|nr:SGNH/GDSL hydrolase family protein [Dermatophilaceae bacterium]
MSIRSRAATLFGTLTLAALSAWGPAAPAQAASVTPATAAATASPATLDPSSAHARTRYLALGDSLAAGHQPDRADRGHGGYVGHVLDALRDSRRTRLTNLACSGETSVTLVEGGVCSYPHGSQLAEAVDRLRRHPGTFRLITLDIGANDVVSCASGSEIDLRCIQAGLTNVSVRLRAALAALRLAAPGVPIVVLNYYDPILAAWLLGPTGQAVAAKSVELLQTLNGIIAVSAAAAGATTADVATAFASTDVSVVWLPGFGRVPLNVKRICGWTWICDRGDIHANARGYAVMGAAVVAVLPSATRVASSRAAA